MTVWGLSIEKARTIAATLELEIDNSRREGRGIAFRLSPPHSRHRYARKSASGRRLKSCSYEAFRDFIASCFKSGATRVKTMLGDWNSLSEFRCDLSKLWTHNVGSHARPGHYGSLSNSCVRPVTIKV